MPAKRYKVILTEDERSYLTQWISTGRRPAQSVRRAQILPKADESQGQGWIDKRICEALDILHKTVEQTRQRFVEQGLQAALNRKKRLVASHYKFDGAQEAHLITLACSKPPQGRSRWTLQLLADKMVELRHFDSISAEAVRQTLKKTSSSLGKRSNGVFRQKAAPSLFVPWKTSSMSTSGPIR